MRELSSEEMIAISGGSWCGVGRDAAAGAGAAGGALIGGVLGGIFGAGIGGYVGGLGGGRGFDAVMEYAKLCTN